MSNAELFSTVAREYANFRLGYPAELFAWLARVSPAHEAVWDCGCGSGQASVALTEHLSQVHATVVAPEQVTAAKAPPRVRYAVAPAEHSGLEDATVDQFTVAQALHCFDVEAFYLEARCFARPGALLAAWNYPRPQFIDPELDRLFLDFYSDVVGSYWPSERRHIEANYRTLPFPFEELPHPEFGIALVWNLDQVAGYVSSWSATARYRKAEGRDPVPLLRQAMDPVWPAAGTAGVRMPIGMRAARLR